MDFMKFMPLTDKITAMTIKLLHYQYKEKIDKIPGALHKTVATE
jgi:phage-related baseplate assembly protein